QLFGTRMVAGFSLHGLVSSSDLPTYLEAGYHVLTLPDGDFAPGDKCGLCRKMNEIPSLLNRHGQRLAGRADSRERASAAYARGLWTDTTLADSLRQAAQQTPDRVLLIDAENRIDCRTL